MPSVEEVLKQTGFTDDQIKAMDARAMEAFRTVLSSADTAQAAAAKEKENAELALRSNQDLYQNQIVPALDGWGTEKANLEAQVAFYQKQNESARSSGFIPKDAPGYTAPAAAAAPARDERGQFVPGANAVPGSPAYMTLDQGLTALSNAQWVMSEHIRLFGQPIPDEFETVLREATAQRMPFRDYADRKYGFSTKKKEMTEKAAKEHDDKIKADAIAERDKYWAERGGNNPNLRTGSESSFAKVQAGIKSGAVKDPLMMTKEQRHQQTTNLVQTEIRENESSAVH
jgi:hypothetical protein